MPGSIALSCFESTNSCGKRKPPTPASPNSPRRQRRRNTLPRSLSGSVFRSLPLVVTRKTRRGNYGARGNRPQRGHFCFCQRRINCFEVVVLVFAHLDLTSITVTPSSLSLEAGDTQQYTAACNYLDSPSANRASEVASPGIQCNECGNHQRLRARNWRGARRQSAVRMGRRLKRKKRARNDSLYSKSDDSRMHHLFLVKKAPQSGRNRSCPEFSFCFPGCG